MHLGRLGCEPRTLLGGYRLSGLTSSLQHVAGERCDRLMIKAHCVLD